MNKKEETTKTYDDNAQQFQQIFDQSKIKSRFIDQVFSLCPRKEPIVLELGCGYGRDAKKILAITPHYLGIDISPNFISLAKKLNQTGDFQVADMETFIFPQKYDIVFSFASLLHCNYSSVEKIFARVYDSLNPHGLFHILLRTADYHEEKVIDKYGARYFYYYSLDDISRLSSKKFNILLKREEQFSHCWLEIILQKIT